MKQDAFFAQLRREFQNDPYRDRFLAELEDHAEDLAEAQKIGPKSLNSGFMQKHFGEPKQVKKDFVSITRPWQKWLEASEAFGYGILMVFWLTAFTLIDFISSNAVPFFIQILIVGLFLFIPYPFIWKKLLKGEKILSRRFLLIYVMLPLFVFFVLQSLQIYYVYIVGGRFLGTTDYYIVFNIISMAMGLLAYWVVSQRKLLVQPLKEIRLKKILLNGLGALFFAYVSFFSVLRLLADEQFNSARWLYSLWLDNFLYIISAIDEGLLYMLPASFNSLFGTHMVRIVILLGLLLWGVMYIILKKRFSWLALTAIVYSLTPFFAPSLPPHGAGLIQSEFSYLTVSDSVLKKELAPFSNMGYYFRGGLEDSAYYAIEPYQEAFLLNKRGNSEAVLRPKERFFTLRLNQDEKGVEIVRLPFSEIKGIPLIEGFNFTWPQDYLCEGPDLGGDIKGICTKVLYKNQLLVKQFDDLEFPVKDLVVSKDGRWVMMVIGFSRMSDGVYLFDLSSLTDARL